jgi:hypothetical protein
MLTTAGTTLGSLPLIVTAQGIGANVAATLERSNARTLERSSGGHCRRAIVVLGAAAPAQSRALHYSAPEIGSLIEAREKVCAEVTQKSRTSHRAGPGRAAST